MHKDTRCFDPDEDLALIAARGDRPNLAPGTSTDRGDKAEPAGRREAAGARGGAG